MSRKYFFIMEIILGLAILVTIDQLFITGSTGYFGVSPHPYWVVILLIACRYGTLQGVTAGSAAAVVYILLAAHAGDVHFERFSFPHGPFKLPFFFILVGGILGEIRGLHKKIQAHVQEKYDAKKEKLRKLTVEHEALMQSKEELDRRIAFQSTTMVSLFEKLVKLEQLGPDHFFKKIPELLRDQLNVQCSSVYLVENNRLQLKVREGCNPSGSLPDTVELTEGMMGEVVRKKSMVSLNVLLKENKLDGFDKAGLIMSAPVLRKDESIVGVINIESLPFFDFNSNTVKIFETLAYWISIVVDRSIQFHNLKDRNVADEITGAYNYPYFQKRLSYETARAKRFHSTISLVLLEIRNFEEMTESEKNNVLVVLNWIFSHILREIDIISKYKNDSTFAIMLPGQSSMDSEKVLQRLTSEIDNYQLRPFEGREAVLDYEIALSTLQVTEGSYESLIRTAEERLKSGGVRKAQQVYDDIDYLLNLKSDEEKKDDDNPVTR